VEPGRPEELADGMLKLLTAGQALCELVGREAREWALREFGIATMVQRYLKVYSEEVNKRHRNGRV
jgi:glycosyltransferase involved in cell wall biosynthesis